MSMGRRVLATQMAKAFDDIYALISSHAETHAATRPRLSEGMRRRMRTEERIPERDVEEFLRVRFTQAFPRTAVMLSKRIVGRVREAFSMWLDFISSIERVLKEAGLTWNTVIEAAELFLGGPGAIEELSSKEPDKLAKYNIAASLAASTAFFNIYSIPVCLRVIFPYADPERASSYIQEARRAFALVALAHLKRMQDRGSWDEAMLRRLRFMSELMRA